MVPLIRNDDAAHNTILPDLKVVVKFMVGKIIRLTTAYFFLREGTNNPPLIRCSPFLRNAQFSIAR